jgi:hypothetical protein
MKRNKSMNECFVAVAALGRREQTRLDGRAGAAAAAGIVRACCQAEVTLWLVKGNIEGSRALTQAQRRHLRPHTTHSLVSSHHNCTRPPSLPRHSSALTEYRPLLYRLRSQLLSATGALYSDCHAHPELFVEPSGHPLSRYPTPLLHRHLQEKVPPPCLSPQVWPNSRARCLSRHLATPPLPVLLALHQRALPHHSQATSDHATLLRLQHLWLP